MSYKILEQNGIDNENVDGGAFNRFAAGGRDGIVQGILSECSLIAEGNGVSIHPGLILICGIRVKITSAETLFVSSVPINPTQYQIIAQLSLADNHDVAVELFLRSPESLLQDTLYRSGHGVYQVEIGSFVHNPDGTISNLVRTLDVIQGGGTGGGNFEVGEIATETLEAGLEAEFDVTKRIDDNGKTLLDFYAAIPKGADGNDAEAVHFTQQDLSDSQKAQVRKNIDAVSASDVLDMMDGNHPLMSVGKAMHAKNADSATKLSNTRAIDGVSFDGTDNIDHFATCSTASGTVAKVVSKSGFVLAVGAKITVKFTNSNTANSPTLNVNGTGAKYIQADGDLTYVKWIAGAIMEFIYDGTYWVCFAGYALAGKRVGAIYQSENSTSPATLYGGSWTAITSGYYLKAITSGSPAYQNAGLPNITGNLYARNSTASSGLGNESSANGAFGLAQVDTSKHKTFGDSNSSYQVSYVTFDANNGATAKGIYGNSQTVTPMNYGAYMWRRTA